MSRARASSRRTQPEDVGTHFQPRTTAMPRPPGLPSGHTLAQLAAADNDSLVLNVSIPATTDDNDSYNSRGNSTDSWTSSFLDPGLGLEVTTAGKTTEDYSKLKEQFYQSYNPQVGVHTAAVLGGILGWLIVYLVYKTKIKKWVISLAKRKSSKRQQRQKEKEVCEVFAEFEDHDLNPDPFLFQCPNPKDLHVPQLMQQRLWQTEHLPQHSDCHPQLQDYRHLPFLERSPGDLTSPFNQCQACGTLLEDSLSKHQCPMPSIVVDSYTSIPPAEAAAGNPQALSEQGCASSSAKKARKKTEKEKKKRYRRKRNQGRSRQFPGVTVVDVEEPDTKCLLPPPCTQTDSARATARWVQNMPLLMRSQLDVNGLILQVQPQLLGSQKQSSCPLISNALHFAAALPLLGLPSTGWNNSMPTLVDRSLETTSPKIMGSGGGKPQDTSRKVGLDDEDLSLLQPVPCCAARTRSSFSHPERSSTQAHLSISPPLSLRSPSPRLTADLLPTVSSSAAANLAVPGSGPRMTSCYSAPTSPVPIPVTPKVTILRKSSSRGSRGLPYQHQQHHHQHHPDSEASISSSLSSFDPLTQLQPDCHCDHQPQLQHQHHHHHQQQQQQQRHVDPSLALTSSRASWTVFDDDDDDKVESCSEVGGSCGRGQEERCSRQNSCRSDLSSPSLRQPGNNGQSGPHDTAWTLETKL